MSRNIIENRERGQGTVGREKEGREHTNSAVEGTLVSQAPLTAFGRERG